MSVVADRIITLAEQSAVTACWRQWSALAGAGITGARPAESIIDPEALVLMSLTVRERERRLQDLLLWWSSVGSPLMSVQRIRTLLESYPESVGRDLGWFAARCLDAGDVRWRQLALPSERLEIGARPGKGPATPQLLDSSTLMLRLRAGFGVGAKADLLAFLISKGGSAPEGEPGATVEALASAISYSTSSVRRATGDMTLARFLRASGRGPVRYRANSRAWSQLLDFRDHSRWRFLAHLYAFLTRSINWATETREVPPVVQASRARDISDEFERVLSWNRIETPEPDLHPGELYLDAFREMVATVCQWLEEHV